MRSKRKMFLKDEEYLRIDGILGALIFSTEVFQQKPTKRIDFYAFIISNSEALLVLSIASEDYYDIEERVLEYYGIIHE